jgi:serine/threonine-protein kinase
MSFGRDPLGDPRFATLDAQGMVELCSSLAEYGEAGGLSRDLMLQVGGFAEARFAREVEVMLAVSRMYLLGGEADRARAALVRAGRDWPDESRVTPLLTHALQLLDDPRSVEEALRDGPQGEGARRSAMPPARSAPPPQRLVPHRADTPPGLPVVKVPDSAGRPGSSVTSATTPRMRPPSEEQVRAAVASARQTTPRRHSVRPASVQPLAPTPHSGMPAVPRAPRMPRGMGEVITASGTPSGRAARLLSEAKGGRAAVARVPVEEAVHAAELRTEVGRRAEPRTPAHHASSPESGDAPASLRNPGGVPRNTRIRLLDPDDERRRLDPYELIGELASGGMATVFLGRLAGAGGFQRFVAIKRLHPHLAREEQFVEMFLDEARLAAGIHHPHVVPILEVGQSDAGYFLVMEFIEGDTLGGIILRALQHGAGVPPGVGARIVIDALAGLHAAHQLSDGDGHYLGLVHRDVTPQNILVGVDGSARITDFGVARAASRLAMSRPMQVKGKVAYLSPEQAHALELDRRSDIFTMGIVLWETLAGRPLFQGDTEAATLARLLGGQIPDVRAFAPGVPAALDDVCRRAMALDRNRRFRTAAEMAEAIERAATTEGFGGIASPRELGRFVEGLMGAEIAAQRESVRSWLSQSDASPASRAPRSTAVGSGRSGSSARSVPPMTGVHATPRAPAESRGTDGPTTAPSPTFAISASGATDLRAGPSTPRSGDEAPETPAPRGEKRPRLSSTPPPLPAEEPAASPRAAAQPVTPPRPAPEAPPDASEPPPAEAATGAAAPEPEAAPAPSGLVAARTAVAFSWLRRLVGMKISNRGGALLVAVIVLLAVAPLAYKMVRKPGKAARAAAAATASSRAGAAPRRAAPAPMPTAAWDEWPVPEGGTVAPDEAPADKPEAP